MIFLMSLTIFGFNTVIVNLTLVLCILLFVREAIELKIYGAKRYFTILKNYIDLCGQIFYVSFYIAYCLEIKELHYVFVASLGCGLIRGSVTLFNLFTSTRYLTKMVITIMSELGPFLILLIAQVFVFGLIFI